MANISAKPIYLVERGRRLPSVNEVDGEVEESEIVWRFPEDVVVADIDYCSFPDGSMLNIALKVGSSLAMKLVILCASLLLLVRNHPKVMRDA